MAWGGRRRSCSKMTHSCGWRVDVGWWLGTSIPLPLGLSTSLLEYLHSRVTYRLAYPRASDPQSRFQSHTFSPVCYWPRTGQLCSLREGIIQGCEYQPAGIIEGHLGSQNHTAQCGLPWTTSTATLKSQMLCSILFLVTLENFILSLELEKKEITFCFDTIILTF